MMCACDGSCDHCTIKKLRAELDACQRIFAAAIYDAGGQLSVSNRSMIMLPDNVKIIRSNSPSTDCAVFSVGEEVA